MIGDIYLVIIGLGTMVFLVFALPYVILESIKNDKQRKKISRAISELKEMSADDTS